MNVATALRGRSLFRRTLQRSCDRRIVQPEAQLALEPAVFEPTRFAHERIHHRRHHGLELRTRHAGRPRQSGGVGDDVEVLGHLQRIVVDRVVDTCGGASLQRCDADARQVLGVDVVAVDVVGIGERGQLLAQAFQWQAIVRIDARHAQHRPAPAAAHRTLGIDASLCALAGRTKPRGLVDPPPTMVAVDAGGADIHRALHCAGKHRRQTASAHVDELRLSRRSQMQHPRRESPQASQRAALVEVAYERHDAGGAQQRCARRRRRECHDAEARGQP